jgi:2-succinyl-5-enolpyruvyl-6-hydroxy-3-cyclohexene-1-carboxylate synthase
VGENRPETVLHLGGRLVSKHVAAYISQGRPKAHILISGHPERQDPGHDITFRMEGDLSTVCSDLAERLGRQKATPWLVSWQETLGTAQKVFDRFTAESDNLTEPLVASLISQNIPSDHSLFLANSMPVRDMDVFADVSGPPVPVGTNRGASGIDGTVACAAGFARGHQRPVTLLVGDLAFLHDLNSLNYLRGAQFPVVAVVINNNGGGIFSFLPIARFEQVLEKYFVTPHDLTFEHVATMYNLPYYRPESRQEFLRHYQMAVKGTRSAILEIRLDRKKNHARHSRLVTDIMRALGN